MALQHCGKAWVVQGGPPCAGWLIYMTAKHPPFRNSIGCSIAFCIDCSELGWQAGITVVLLQEPCHVHVCAV